MGKIQIDRDTLLEMWEHLTTVIWAVHRTDPSVNDFSNKTVVLAQLSASINAVVETFETLDAKCSTATLNALSSALTFVVQQPAHVWTFFAQSLQPAPLTLTERAQLERLQREADAYADQRIDALRRSNTQMRQQFCALEPVTDTFDVSKFTTQMPESISSVEPQISVCVTIPRRDSHAAPAPAPSLPTQFVDALGAQSRDRTFIRAQRGKDTVYILARDGCIIQHLTRMSSWAETKPQRGRILDIWEAGLLHVAVLGPHDAAQGIEDFWPITEVQLARDQPLGAFDLALLHEHEVQNLRYTARLASG